MRIVPDDKDWTWVMTRVCPDCGFDAATFDVTWTARTIRDNATAWQDVLLRTDVRERPRPDVWSPLEYACHVRDVFALFHQRLLRMLTEEDPLFANWDQDATAIEKDYPAQNPATVSIELVAAAEELAATFETVQDWTRPGRRSDGAVYTVASFAAYLVHDPVHHLWDVKQ